MQCAVCKASCHVERNIFTNMSMIILNRFFVMRFGSQGCSFKVNVLLLKYKFFILYIHCT